MFLLLIELRRIEILEQRIKAFRGVLLLIELRRIEMDFVYNSVRARFDF